MKKLLAVVLMICLLMSFSSFAVAESNGTIMWLSNLSSGIQYEAARDYLQAICDAMGYDFTVVYGDSFNDAAGNLTAVQNGMTGDVKGIIASQDGGLAAIMEQYPDIYVAGYNTDMSSVFDEGGVNAAVLENDHFLGTICDGFADGADMGHQYFEEVQSLGWKRISIVHFPGYAYPTQIEAVDAFIADMEAYNATVSEDEQITLVGEPLMLEFQTLPDSYFLEDGTDDLDGIVSFCAGLMYVYPTLVTAKMNGFARQDTQLITGGFENNPDIVADIGSAEEGKTIAWICVSPFENPAYALVLLDNAITGNQFPDFKVECIDSASYVIDSSEDVEAAMTRAMFNTPDVSLAQISVDEVLQLARRFNSDATYEGLKEVFHSEQVTVEALFE